MERSDYLAAVADYAEALRSAAHKDLNAPVQSCPGWAVADIVRHVAVTHGWAASIVSTGSREDLPPMPAGLEGADLIAWSDQQASALVAALASADPDADVWTFGQPRSVRFWLRRQAQETAMHAWDARRAVGAPIPLPPALAADGLDEFLHLIVPRVVKRKPQGWTGQTLHLHRADGDGEWHVRLGPDGETLIETRHAKGDAALRGDAADLLLWATGRQDTTPLETYGDEGLLDRWKAEIEF